MSLVVLLVVSAVLGAWALRPLKMGSGVEGVTYRLLVGLSLSAVVILAVGSVSLRACELVMNVLAVAGLGFELFVYSRRETETGAPPNEPPRLSKIEWTCLAAAGGALGMALVSALAPVTGWDACVAHLTLAQDYAREGRIHLVAGNEYAAYPHLLTGLFAFVFFQNGETGAAFLSWLLGLLACGAAYVLGRRIEGRRCGIIAAAILATAPIFLDQAGTVSIDLAFAGFTLAALAGLVAWHDEKRSGWILVSGFLAGASCGIRHTGYLVGALLALTVLFGARERRTWRMAGFCALGVVGALPWLARSAVLVGNPFYPFFSALLGSGALPGRHVTALAAHESARDVGVFSFLRFPWDIVMRPQLFDGWTKSPGGLVLILGIPGLFIGGRRARWLGAFSGAGLACYYFFLRLARYLLPFFAPMMVVAAVAACRLTALRRAVTVVLIVLFAYGLALDAAAVRFKVPVVFGLEKRDDYLARRVERYAAFAWVNENVPCDQTILTFDRRTYYIKGRTYQNDEPLRRLRDQPVSGQAAWLKAHGIRWVFLPLTYIEESPEYRAEILDMVNTWRRHRRYFVPAQSFDLPRPRAKGTERVEIYEVRYEE